MKLRIYSLYFIVCISVLASTSLQAQRSCSSNSLMEKFYQEVPEARSSFQESIKMWKEAKKSTKRSSIDVTIPVHIIIVHPPGQAVGTGDNLSMAHIQSQIDVLNTDFPGLNSDISNVPSQFAVGSSDIKFCLATIDPNGNNTDGVTRFATDLQFSSNNFSIMEQTIWNSSTYLNIYVTSTITDLGFSPVASPLYTIPPMWDAPTVATSTFGGPGYGTLNNYDLGRTAVHEIGHWLGLNHLWGPMSGGCSEDDGMDDTPIQDIPTVRCPDHPLPSCSSPAIFFMNFMDYVDDDCMLAFSADQVDYMHFIIENVRPGLIGAHLTKCENIVAPNPVVGTLLSSTNESCSGSNNGSASISGSGGTGPYNYSLDGGPLQGSGTFNNLAGGNHTVTIYDIQNITGNLSFNISIATPILIEVVAVTNPCGNNNDGSFGVVASGGNPGGLTISVNQNTSANNFFTGLNSNNYTIRAADTQGCIEELSYTLAVNSDPFSPITTNITYPVFGDCTTNPNSVSVQFTSNPNDAINNISLSNGMSSSNGIFTGLATGSYNYTVSNSAGCQETGNFVIDQEYYYDISYTSTLPTCANTSNGSLLYTNTTNLQISVVMAAGTSTGPTSYTNIPPGIHQVSVYGFNNCLLSQEMINFNVNELIASVQEITPDCATGLSDFRVSATGGSGQINYTFNGMTNTTGYFQHADPGVHQVVVTDGNDCAQAVLVEIEGIDTPISANATLGQEILCFGETTFININVQGGAPPYEYILNGIAQSGPFIENLGGGAYNLLVRSASECADDFSWQGEIIEYEELTMENISISDSECTGQGGTFSSEIFDGSPPYFYILDETQTYPMDELPNLNNGQHTIQAQDSNGCTSEAFVFNINDSEAVNLDIEVLNQVSCFGLSDGSVNIITDVTTGPINYEWNIPTSDFQALPAGSYSLTVTNSDGCAASANFEITQPDQLTLQSEIIAPQTSTENGSAQFIMNGGTPPYTYTINENQNNNGFFSLNQGNYSIDIADANGCSLSNEFTISFFSSTENETTNFRVELYPNPTEDKLTVDCSTCAENASYIIYSADGKKLLDDLLSAKASIDVSSLANGFYFLIVNQDEKSSVHKFVKL